mmetsp:Transcript_10988/g.24046  ORF Transcript_10988/g.24046 Transcript_10988/m.24046 type:complete len:320 (-) Transcript_10988:1025-1984(-)
MCDGSRSEAKKEKEICRYFVHGRCKKGKWCEFSHHRPLCRYGSHCWFGPWCWNSHGITPRVNSIRTARKPGKQSARNKRRREKRKVLMAEAKASLVKIKELETQLGLKEKKTDELQESERQLAGLQAQLEEETRIAKAHQERAITTDLELTQVTEMMVTAKEKCAEEVSSMKSESEKREKMLHEMKEHYVNLEQYTEKLADALKLEQEKNVILGMDLKLEQEKNREQVLKQYRIAAKAERLLAQQAELQHVQSRLPGGQETQTQAVELGGQERAQLGSSWSTGQTARWPTFFGPAERGCSGHASSAPPGCGHPPDPEQS